MPRFVRFNGTLDFSSVYRGRPSPEIDAAWNHISYDSECANFLSSLRFDSSLPLRLFLTVSKAGVFSLPEDEALRAGLQKGDVRIPAGYEGSGGYMASLELTHQLHCVVSRA
jgi:hypothetical protein